MANYKVLRFCFLICCSVFFAGYAVAEEQIMYHDNGEIKQIANYEGGAMNGPYEERYENGNTKSQGQFVNGKAEEDWYYYDEDGRLIRKATYKNGNVEGVVEEYFEDASVKSETEYSNNLPNGSFKVYDKEGNVLVDANYKNGALEGKYLGIGSYRNGAVLPLAARGDLMFNNSEEKYKRYITKFIISAVDLGGDCGSVLGGIHDAVGASRVCGDIERAKREMYRFEFEQLLESGDEGQLKSFLRSNLKNIGELHAGGMPYELALKLNGLRTGSNRESTEEIIEETAAYCVENYKEVQNAKQKELDKLKQEALSLKENLKSNSRSLQKLAGYFLNLVPDKYALLRKKYKEQMAQYEKAMNEGTDYQLSDELIEAVVSLYIEEQSKEAERNIEYRLCSYGSGFEIEEFMDKIDYAYAQLAETVKLDGSFHNGKFSGKLYYTYFGGRYREKGRKTEISFVDGVIDSFDGCLGNEFTHNLRKAEKFMESTYGEDLLCGRGTIKNAMLDGNFENIEYMSHGVVSMSESFVKGSFKNGRYTGYLLEKDKKGGANATFYTYENGILNGPTFDIGYSRYEGYGIFNYATMQKGRRVPDKNFEPYKITDEVSFLRFACDKLGLTDLSYYSLDEGKYVVFDGKTREEKQKEERQKRQEDYQRKIEEQRRRQAEEQLKQAEQLRQIEELQRRQAAEQYREAQRPSANTYQGGQQVPYGGYYAQPVGQVIYESN